jgi:hypothetical protein
MHKTQVCPWDDMPIGIPFSKIVNILDKQHDPNSFVTKFVYKLTKKID